MPREDRHSLTTDYEVYIQEGKKKKKMGIRYV